MQCDVIELDKRAKCSENAAKNIGHMIIPGIYSKVNLCEKHYNEIKKYSEEVVKAHFDTETSSFTPITRRRVSFIVSPEGEEILRHHTYDSSWL